jgi:hypothetical protein
MDGFDQKMAAKVATASGAGAFSQGHIAYLTRLLIGTQFVKDM